jgi:quercetin 2,3-dioxygenase
MGPATVTADSGVDIGPHPHIGLQTVTWLAAGEVLHRDSLGSEQVIKPGQLNLMTAGRGVAHAEEATGQYAGSLHGIQLWVAQPAATRDGAPAFEHWAELPQVDFGAGGEATVLVGSLAGVTSTARRDTDHFGAELLVRGACDVPVEAGHELALVVLDGRVTVDGVDVEPGRLAYVAPGRSSLDVAGEGRALLLGGEPFESEIFMWWNFVARTTDEIDAAYDAWQAGGEARFGPVDSRLPRIPAPSERLWRR